LPKYSKRKLGFCEKEGERWWVTAEELHGDDIED